MKYTADHVEVYEGPYDYLFISYAHADAERVLPIMKRLADDGVRLWYDDGIEIGSSWDDNIAHHIKNAKGVVLLFSNNYFKSSNCKDEANYARDLGKDQIIIQLEDTQIPAGMEMRLNRIQSVSVTGDADLMYKKIYASSVLKHCRRIGTEAEQDQENAAAAASAAVKPGSNIRKIVIAAAALAVLALVLFFATRKPPQNLSAAAESSQENAASENASSIENPSSADAASSAESTAVSENVSSAENTADQADGSSVESAASEPAEAESAGSQSAAESAPDSTAPDENKYNLGDTVEIYKAGTDTVEYTIRVDDVHVMPEDFNTNMWEKFDPDQLELVSVKCTIENFGFSKGKEEHLQLYMLNQEHTVMVKDMDDFMMRSVDALYHGSDGVYDVITTNAIPAGSKGRLALMFYVEKGTESVTVSVDNHNGVILKSDPIALS